MSFLNPVNEPVLRFKSTDAGAPQINYATRTAGDIKAILKSCLVTGYGAKASAGWTAANEVANVIEFVSPSAAMSDYRLGVDDNLATKTTWFYQHQDTRTNPANNAPNKSISGITTANPNNGWQLLVTERGILFIEVMYITAISELSARITYWGQIKSAITDTGGKNIGFLCVGNGSAIQYTNQFFNQAYTNFKHYNVSNYTNVNFAAANLSKDASSNVFDSRDVNLTSAIYLYSGQVFVGVQPAFLYKDVNKRSDLYGVYDTVIDGRPALHVCVGIEASSISFIENSSRAVVAYLDNWGY